MNKFYDLVIRNANVFTASENFFCDIGIKNGQIVTLSTELGIGLAEREVDACGRVVTPGGVDAHCHLDQQMSGPAKMADNFFTGTRSAACGGTTTIIPFAAQLKGGTLQQAVDDYHRKAKNNSFVDYAFHLIITDPSPMVLEGELPLMPSLGYTSFKVYMTYEDLKLNDYQILSILDISKKIGALTMIHAENSDAIKYLTERLLINGCVEPINHSLSRPMAVEREATHRAITLAELIDVPILIVHVSGKEAIEQITLAKNKGLNIYSETCPQYLFLSQDDLMASNFCGAKFVCSPPPRDKNNQEEVWKALGLGLFDIFSSDHAPFCFEGPYGKKSMGEHPNFPNIPNGLPGLETRLPLLFSFGVSTKKISIQKFVEITSTNPAKLFGLYPRKGTISIGSDADIVIWNTACSFVIKNGNLHHAVDYTPYEGYLLDSWPLITFLRGKIIWEENKFCGHHGDGEFLKCGHPNLLL